MSPKWFLSHWDRYTDEHLWFWAKGEWTIEISAVREYNPPEYQKTDVHWKEQLIAISGSAGEQEAWQITGPHVLQENRSGWISTSTLIWIIFHHYTIYTNWLGHDHLRLNTI
jgi:hypothetical protein